MEPVRIAPTPGSNFGKRLKGYLEEWPTMLTELIQNPIRSMRTLPVAGSWERPFCYAVASGILSGLIQFVLLVKYSFGLAFGSFLSSVIVVSLLMPIGGFLVNLVASTVRKEPGLYRTIHFFGLISIASPVITIAALIHPLLAALAQLAVLYGVFLYVRTTAEFTKKEGLIFIGAIFLLGIILGTLGQMSAVGSQMLPPIAS